MFLKENRDAEPDIALDRNHRIADQYGMETTEVERLMVFVGEIRPELEKQREEFKEKLGEIKRDPKNRNMSRDEYEDLRREIRVNDELSDDILNKLKDWSIKNSLKNFDNCKKQSCMNCNKFLVSPTIPPF